MMDLLVFLVALAIAVIAWRFTAKKFAEKNPFVRHGAGLAVGLLSFFVVLSLAFETGIIKEDPEARAKREAREHQRAEEDAKEALEEQRTAAEKAQKEQADGVAKNEPLAEAEQQPKENLAETKIEDAADHDTPASDKTDKAALKKEFRTLWKELLGFKDNRYFHEVGFSRCCMYNDWLTRVEAARNEFDGHTQVSMGLLFVELQKVGMGYMRNHGKDNDYTREMAANFNKALK